MMLRLSAAQARRIALAATGLAAPRPAVPSRRQVVAANARLGMFQIDSVNILARAHLMPPFSRLGAYEMVDFEAVAWGRKRAMFETWAHEACLVPMATWPLLQWRMDRQDRSKYSVGLAAQLANDRPEFIASVLEQVRDRGALAAAELTGGGSATGKWWGWSDSKMAAEYLFAIGELCVSHRRGAFERVYDLPERVIPAAIRDLPVPDRAEAQRGLLRIAAAATGVATEIDLRAYWRLKPEAKPRVEELVEAGELIPCEVEGWKPQAYIWHEAKTPRRVEAAALLSPFDPLLFERDRALRTLGFHYRIGLYTPKEQRTDGYYVLPFLHGDRIAARVDLKADRKDRVLHVHAANLEDHAETDTTAHALAQELRALSGWLGMERIAVARRGNLASALHDACTG
ncbi:MAG: winged helix DNA-binding domain-containing protein [Alphaproteobacteria bacterium]|nr:winged helix DNA-binding domain-containing protein [Alphaproteobacteria bacterium]